MTSTSVTIDAGVLAVPPQDGAAEAAHRYVETLLDWSKLLTEPWVAIYMSDRASEALFEDGLYPLRDSLKALFVAQGIVEYDVNTVASVVDRLLQQTPSFETYFSISDVLTEDLTLEPDVLRLCSGQRLQSDLARCVVLIAVLRGHCRKSTADHSLVLRDAPARTLRVRALIHDLEHKRDDLDTLPVPPEYFDGDVLICDDFRGLVECLDEAAILVRANDELAIQTALRVGLYKARLGNGVAPEWDDVPPYGIGRSFRESLCGCRPTTQLAGRVIRAMMETLEGTNLSATHALRTGRGGNDPQRVRQSDQAKAWRRDVDCEHHLHYWISNDGLVEFAWLSCPHDDMTMPE